MQQPGSMTAMANGPPSGGMMRPPGPPGGPMMGGPPGPPGMPGAPGGYGAQQVASSMQQMSLGGPPVSASVFQHTAAAVSCSVWATAAHAVLVAVAGLPGSAVVAANNNSWS
jgi:hypothetical protein